VSVQLVLGQQLGTAISAGSIRADNNKMTAPVSQQKREYTGRAKKVIP